MAKMNAINPKRPTLKAVAPPYIPEIDPDSALLLVDWNGALLRSYTFEETLALDALPAESGAVHELLQFQEWNWELDNIKSWLRNNANGQLIVGAIYTTDDGENHNYWRSPQLVNERTIYMQKRGIAGFRTTEFSGYSSLSQINIPDNCRYIGEYVFNRCYSLRFLSVPDSVISIEDNAFEYCYSLRKICLPDKLTAIRRCAFNECYSLEMINLPEGITDIGAGAFSACYSLAYVNIPKSITTINPSTFSNCYSLSKIDIPDSVAAIGDGAFYGCRELYDVIVRGRPSIISNNTFLSNKPNQRFYVHRADLSWYSSEQYWSRYYAQGRIVAAADHLDHLREIGIDVTDFENE